MAVPDQSATTVNLASASFLENPWPLYAQLRQNDPIHWSSPNGCFFLTTWRDVRQALTSSDFTIMHPSPEHHVGLGPTFHDLDGEDHRRLRSLLSERFRRSHIPGYLRTIIEPVTREVLAHVADDEQVDFLAEFAIPVATRVAARIIGLPEHESAWLFELASALMQQVTQTPAALRLAENSTSLLERYLSAIVADQRRVAEGTVLADVVGAGLPEGRVNTAEVVPNIFLLYAAATGTTTAAIGNSLIFLLRHPQMWEAAQRDQRLIGPIIRETLRLEPSLSVVQRFTTRDVLLGDVLIVEGTPVQLCLGSANRNEELFADPERWDIGRPEQGDLAFGNGKHACFGAYLATAELETVLRILLDEFNLVEPVGQVPPIVGTFLRGPRTLPIHVRRRAR